MKILTSEKLSDHKYVTDEGYLVCVDAILARTGKQTYLEKELFDDKKNSTEQIEVLRTENEVFDEKTIASFENKPITIEHPESFVDIKNHKELSVGFVRDVQKKNIEGDDFLVGNLIITNKEAIDIVNKGKKYLSCGYDCDIVNENDQWLQKNIRGNHIALCDNPRAGNTMIQDSKVILEKKDFDIKDLEADCKELNLKIIKTNDKYEIIGSRKNLEEFIDWYQLHKSFIVDEETIFNSFEKVIELIKELKNEDNENKINIIIKLLKQMNNNLQERKDEDE